MNYLLKSSLFLLGLVFLSCNGNSNSKKKPKLQLNTVVEQPVVAEKKAESKEPASKRIDLENKGVGPIKSITLAETIDQTMVASGKEVFDKTCSACHKIKKRLVGPPMQGILKRRSPEWVMNMILAPGKMVKEDPLAKDLLMEFYGSPMANQNLSKEQTRAILEYFRTI